MAALEKSDLPRDLETWSKGDGRPLPAANIVSETYAARNTTRMEGQTRQLIFQYDNAWPHVAKAVLETLRTLDWEVLPNKPYSASIAQSDYHLFWSTAHGLANQRFEPL